MDPETNYFWTQIILKREENDSKVQLLNERASFIEGLLSNIQREAINNYANSWLMAVDENSRREILTELHELEVH